MRKVRVYELAKKLNMASRDLVAKINELGVPIKSHMSILEGEELTLIEELLANDKGDKNEAATDTKDSKQDKSAKESKAGQDKKASKDKSNKKQAHSHKKKSRNEFAHKKEDKEIEKIEDKKDTEEKEIEIGESIIVRELAEKLDVNVNQLIMKLIDLGIMANQNQDLDFDTAALIAEEFGFNASRLQEEDESVILGYGDFDFEDDEADLKPRPPVVTVMGHVDHGKTSLLDSIRKTKVTTHEAGGITQHIGASSISVDGNKIVFLDTPGHEAFTSMRSRGAQITDIAILVVAADDGVMPQTVEAINHAKAAEVPIIVAINKIDKDTANPDRIKQELTEHGLVPEDWGGDVITVQVSAKNQTGIDDLLEMVLMVAEMEELKANPNRRAVGTVIEARLDKGKGPVATVLVQKGTLKFGDVVVSGISSGKIRAMFDDKSKSIKKAGPSIPVQILGLSEVPESGDMLYVVEDEKTARNYASSLKDQIKAEKVKASENISLEALFGKIKEGEIKDLNIVIKTDVKGTIDAVKNSLEKLSNEEVRVNIIHAGVGGISESDVLLATASNAIIIGFNVRPGQIAIEAAKNQGVDIRTYRVIYDAIDDIKAAINGMLAPKYEEEVIGRAEVRAVFKVPSIGNIAGIYVLSGKLTRNAKIRLLRNDIVITEADINSLKRFKDDVREVNTGYEGGVGLENYNDLKEGDILEAFIMKEVKR
ncbi:MAG: translation initiation factor IF-2 [Tissierellia bacterium]|nr:translation initiation factor IF-2 [Tissierellia bacterium]